MLRYTPCIHQHSAHSNIFIPKRYSQVGLGRLRLATAKSLWRSRGVRVPFVNLFAVITSSGLRCAPNDDVSGFQRLRVSTSLRCGIGKSRCQAYQDRRALRGTSFHLETGSNSAQRLHYRHQDYLTGVRQPPIIHKVVSHLGPTQVMQWRQ